MAERATRSHAPATRAALNSGTAKRIHKLVMRAVQYRYGAEAALRSAVKVGASEMLEAGASCPEVRHEIAQCVVSHPSALPDRPSLVTGEPRTAALLRRMLTWTDEVMTTPSAARSG